MNEKTNEKYEWVYQTCKGYYGLRVVTPDYKILFHMTIPLEQLERLAKELPNFLSIHKRIGNFKDDDKVL